MFLLPSATPATGLPPGLWRSDAGRSTAGFAVGSARARFTDFTARLAVRPDGRATLSGNARAGSLAVADPALAARVADADPFDAARHPELRFESDRIHRAGEHVELDGRLTIRGATLAVAVTGTFAAAPPDAAAAPRIGLELETRLDRRQFGLDEVAGLALGAEAWLQVRLSLIPTTPTHKEHR